MHGPSTSTRWVLLFSASAWLAGCDMLDMYDQPRYKPLARSEFFADGMSARPLVAGTIARGELQEDVAFYTGKVDGRYVDDLPVKLDAALIERGRERFTMFCSMCHGQTGYGNGMVVQRGFEKPPSFHSEKVRSMALGNYFEIMTNGYAGMPPINLQTTPHDRWAIAAYIRALQLSQNARLEDVPEAAHEAISREPITPQSWQDQPAAKSPSGTDMAPPTAETSPATLPNSEAPPEPKASELNPEAPR